MRISDWSSDVCSSDLIVVRPPRHRASGRRPARDQPRPDLRARGAAALDRAPHRPGPADPLRRRRPDRKSVVLGKSVTVRVDLGGRRIIKNKNLEYINDYKHTF